MHLNSPEAKTSKVIPQISGILLPHLKPTSIVSIVCKKSTVWVPTAYLFKIHVNIIIRCTDTSPKNYLQLQQMLSCHTGKVLRVQSSFHELRN